MFKHRFLYALLSAAALCPTAAQSQHPRAASRSVDATLKELQQRWHSAYAAGDLERLKPLLADRFTVTDSMGEVLGIRELALQAALPRDSATLIGSDHQVRFFGNAAVMTSQVAEHRGPHTLRFRVTDTFVRDQGDWRVAASQWTRMESDLKEVKLSAQSLDAFAGSYRTPRGLKISIQRNGDRLMVADPKGQQEEFLALSDSMFISPRSKVRYLFIKEGSAVRHAVIANQTGLVPIARTED